MKFIHAIIFYPDEEVTKEDFPSLDWVEMCFGDYVVHALYSVDQNRIIILDDNCHSPVEDMISNVLIGVHFATNQDEQITECFVIADDPYSPTQVAKKLKNSDYVKVV